MTASKGCVGVIGATSIVGEFLLPLLVQEGYHVVAFSRQEREIQQTLEDDSIIWKCLIKSSTSDINNISPAENKISYWINLAPVWVLPQYFPMLLAYGARHIVTVSSTSKFTKSTSEDPAEKKLAERLKTAEEGLTVWAEKEKISFTILSSTMIYGLGRDGNISVIAALMPSPASLNHRGT